MNQTSCTLCPRSCRVDRDSGEKGFCGETSQLKIAAACLHFGEEPPITGTGGSGAIFVSGCNLRCVFCQNYQISQQGMGKIVSTEEFAQIALALQKSGAENINIVTASHAAEAIANGIYYAKQHGLKLPCLWNSSGYESDSTLEILKNFIDIYLPDLKTLDNKTAADFFNAPDYPKTATNSILKMIATGSPVIIRHLVLPFHLDDTKNVLQWIADNAKDNAQLSVMTQYTPVNIKPEMSSLMQPNRFINRDEYNTVLQWLDDFSCDCSIQGFYQELETSDEWLPDFEKPNPFSSSLSKIIWHWKWGFNIPAMP
ncbi:MAG: radical SAM protein [Termitinemataceae bacterium]|nr:MAG: radical SAM protein [Termitinemataceae bacterium]